ncbi:hypothetical protein ACWCXB_10425 [Streptomyces sp. NPDC001514]
MTNSVPWYMRTTDSTSADKGSPERQRAYLEMLAAQHNEDDDAQIAHLEAIEARGITLTPSTRMSMGYSKNARTAAQTLKENR